jgi:hypothetical protein
MGGAHTQGSYLCRNQMPRLDIYIYIYIFIYNIYIYININNIICHDGLGVMSIFNLTYSMLLAYQQG